GGSSVIRAVIDLIVEGLAFSRALIKFGVCRIRYFAVLRVGQRQVKVVAAMVVFGFRRYAFGKRWTGELPAINNVRDRALDGGLVAAIEINSQRAVRELPTARAVPSTPESHDRPGAVGVHHHVFFAAVHFFCAEELAAVPVGEPR